MKRILICMDPDGHSQKRFLMGAAEIVQPNPNWTVIFDLTPELLTLERWQQYEEDGIVGAIVCETDIPDLDAIIMQTKTPLVIFGATRTTKGSKFAPHGFVMADDVGIGIAGAKHFLSFGHARSYGYVPDPGGAGWSRGHQQGFEQTIREAGGTVNVFSGAPQGFERSRQLREWLLSLPKPAAVMAACDTLGLETISACKSAKIAIPQQVAVLPAGRRPGSWKTYRGRRAGERRHFAERHRPAWQDGCSPPRFDGRHCGLCLCDCRQGRGHCLRLPSRGASRDTRHLDWRLSAPDGAANRHTEIQAVFGQVSIQGHGARLGP